MTLLPWTSLALVLALAPVPAAPGTRAPTRGSAAAVAPRARPAARAGAAATPDPSAPHRELLPGGLELVVLPIRHARTASLRLVVRAGSALDPPGKDGLAHVLEHLVLQGRGADGLDAVQAAAASGAYLNAFTQRDATTYVLDAPAETFPSLAARLLRGVTSPRLDLVDVARELDVVGREDEYQGEGSAAIGLVEDALFRSRSFEATVIGASGSRERIAREDLLRFFRANYTTASSTLVVSGAVTVEDARALAADAILFPPATRDEWPRPPVIEPALPVDERIRAPFLAAVHGYRIEASDRTTCPAAAALIEHRLVAALTAREPLVRSVQAACFTLRGVDFLLAFAYAPTLEASDLPDQMHRAFRSLGQPPTLDERRRMEQRLSRQADWRRDDPAALATFVSNAAEIPRAAGATPLPAAGPVALPVDALRALARRCFVPERRVLIFLSPFEG